MKSILKHLFIKDFKFISKSKNLFFPRTDIFSFYKSSTTKFFSSIKPQLTPLLNQEISDAIEQPLLSHILKSQKTTLNKLTLNILSYLESNQDMYKRWCEDSIKLSYDLGEAENNGNETLKNELIRINKQINLFSKENYYYDELKTY